MPTLKVDPQVPASDIMAGASEIIRRGGLVAFPTETVYGLGANALDEAAVARIYAAKRRPHDNPLIAHVADVDGARRLVTQWPESAERLATAFWPGPLTLVLPRSPDVPGVISAGLPTLAVRVPDHPVALALLRSADLPIVAPSANPSMAVSPTRAEHVEKGLGDRVDLILDAGPTGLGIESTVVDLSGQRPVLLRPGVLSTDDLLPMVGELDSPVVPERAPDPAGSDSIAPRPSPGMLDRHYAPRAAVMLVAASEGAEALAHARRVAQDGRSVGAVLMEESGDGGGAALPDPTVLHPIVRMPREPAGYARELYAALHRLDDAGCELILIEEVPSGPAWSGIRDRLRRAAARPPTDHGV